MRILEQTSSQFKIQIHSGFQPIREILPIVLDAIVERARAREDCWLDEHIASMEPDK
jgi:hypothetical protein